MRIVAWLQMETLILGSYPNFLVGRYFDVLVKHYQIDPKMIGPWAPELVSQAPDAALCLHPNDGQVLRLIRTLDEVGYFQTFELASIFDEMDNLPLLPQQAGGSFVALALAEGRNARTLMDFLNAAVARFSFWPAHRLWLEKVHGKIRIMHAFRNAEEGFIGPQALFAMLCREMITTFELTDDAFAINFLKAGIRDEQGFGRVVRHSFDCWGPVSFLEFRRDPQTILNPRRNPSLDHLLGPMLNAMLPTVVGREGVSGKVQAILGDHMARLHSLPDIDGTASLLGMSRATLFRRLEEEETRFSDLLQNLRIRHAKELLAEGDLNISQVGDRLGFSSVSTFSRSFKTCTGASPVEYRKACRS